MKKIFIGIFATIGLFSTIIFFAVLYFFYLSDKTVKTIVNTTNSTPNTQEIEKPLYLEGTVHLIPQAKSFISNNTGTLHITLVHVNGKLIKHLMIKKPNFPQPYKIDLRMDDINKQLKDGDIAVITSSYTPLESAHENATGIATFTSYRKNIIYQNPMGFQNTPIYLTFKVSEEKKCITPFYAGRIHLAKNAHIPPAKGVYLVAVSKKRQEKNMLPINEEIIHDKQEVDLSSRSTMFKLRGLNEEPIPRLHLVDCSKHKNPSACAVDPSLAALSKYKYATITPLKTSCASYKDSIHHFIDENVDESDFYNNELNAIN